MAFRKFQSVEQTQVVGKKAAVESVRKVGKVSLSELDAEKHPANSSIPRTAQ